MMASGCIVGVSNGSLFIFSSADFNHFLATAERVPDTQPTNSGLLWQLELRGTAIRLSHRRNCVVTLTYTGRSLWRWVTTLELR